MNIEQTDRQIDRQTANTQLSLQGAQLSEIY